MSEGKLWTKDFIFIALVNLFLALNFYLSMIVISQFATERFQATPGQAGAAAGMFVIGLLVARFFTGNLLGRVGLAKVLYTGMGLSVLAAALYFAAASLPLLLGIRFFHGATFGIASTAAATIVANIIPKHRIGEGIGYFGLSMTVASAIGPFLGLMLGRSGNYPLIFWTGIAVSAIAVLAAGFMDKDKLNSAPNANDSGKRFAVSNFLEPGVLPISTASLVLAFCQSSVIGFLALYAQEINLTTAASYFFIVFSAVLFLSRPPVGRLFDRKGENVIMYAAIAIHALGLLVMSQAHTGVTLLLAAALIALGFGSLLSTGQSVAVKSTERHRMGLATSTYFMMTDIGFGLGPFVFGMLIPHTGFRGMYLGASAVVLACTVLYYLLHGRHAAARSTEVAAHAA
jgi:MFS family permease